MRPRTAEFAPSPQQKFTIPGFMVSGFAIPLLLGLVALLAPVRLSAQIPPRTPASRPQETPVKQQDVPLAEGPDTEALVRFDSSVQGLIKKVAPSVVQIVATGYGVTDQGTNGETDVIIGRQRAIGSGFIIDPSGYIITNAHVVKGAEHIDVVLPPSMGSTTPDSSLASRGDIVPARLVGFTSDIDLAVIKIDVANLSFLPLADYNKLVQGEVVFAFGSPQGLRNSVTMGVVSATARQTDPDSPLVYVQTDAPINPGNSGGPLVNVRGEVVGINTFILSQSGGNEGLGFAIPSSIVDVSFQQIRKFGHVHRGEIGVGAQSISPELAQGLHLTRNSGIIVSDVIPGSPAETAGLKVQDVIVTVDRQPVYDLPFFAFHLLTHETGDTVHIEVLRGSNRLAFDVPIIEQPHQIDQIASATDPEKSLIRPLGLLAVELTDKIAGQLPGLRDPHGILIVARSAEATALVPLMTGDVIRALNGMPVATLDALRAALQAVPAGSPIVLQIQREGGLQYVSFTLDQP